MALATLQKLGAGPGEYKGIFHQNMQRVQDIAALLNLDFSKALAMETFSVWPDAWSGAIIVATNDALRSNNKTAQDTVRHYMYAFPRQRLSAEAEITFGEAQRRIDLQAPQALNSQSATLCAPSSDIVLGRERDVPLILQGSRCFHSIALMRHANNSCSFHRKHPGIGPISPTSDTS